MQLLLDNLIAIMVASSLAILLLTQQVSTQQDVMERQSVHAAKVQSLAFAGWVERDVVRLGARFGDDRERFTPMTPTMIGGRPFTEKFEFAYNEGENDLTVDRVQVLYELVATDSVLAAEATPSEPARYVRQYRLDRSERSGLWRSGAYVDAGGRPCPPGPARMYCTWRPGNWANSSGGNVAPPVYRPDRTRLSPAGLSYFYVEPRTSTGVALTDPTRAQEADYVRIQFSVLPTLFPIHRARYIRDAGLSWASTFEIRPF